MKLLRRSLERKRGIDGPGKEVAYVCQKNNVQPIAEDIHAFLEKTLIEAYLKGKGYTLEDLQNLREEEAKQIMKEASTYASGKLAEV